MRENEGRERSDLHANTESCDHSPPRSWLEDTWKRAAGEKRFVCKNRKEAAIRLCEAEQFCCNLREKNLLEKGNQRARNEKELLFATLKVKLSFSYQDV